MHISVRTSSFHGRTLPESGTIVGYAAIVDRLELPVPLPQTISLISDKHRSYHQNGWNVKSLQYQPKESLHKHLVFALKYEGINLLFFKKLFTKLSEQEAQELVGTESTGQYSRKLWFLYEWLVDKQLPIADADINIKYVPLVNEKQQYALKQGLRSSRHRIVNNLPGTRGFCPLVFKTDKLEHYINKHLSEQQSKNLKNIHKDILQRTSAFLMLKDSKASFTIEGESPKSKRAARWGRAIGQAGSRPLNQEELLRLQQLVIEDTRFVNMGFRKQGGFVGEHDRLTGEPLPDHISAKWQDLETLISGLVETSNILGKSDFNAVIAAAMVSFGFVFIHPFEDGNGRLHRYLIHHILARKGFTQHGLIFPVSASILDHIDQYRTVLEKYSLPLLDFIEWEVTSNNNVNVLNDTIDYYRYFDATTQAEFLYDCVYDTIENIIPKEIQYLQQYDTFKNLVNEEFDMPDKTIALLVRFLEQNNGKLSKRAREKEFSALSADEMQKIEEWYQKSFD